MSRIKLLFADDHALFRKSLIPILKSIPQVSKVYEASNGQEVIDHLRFKTRPDLLLLDLNMPLMDGKETAAFVRKNYPEMKIVVLSMYDNERLIAHMIKLGIHGYLLKQAEPEEVQRTIAQVIEHGSYFNDHMAGLIIRFQQKAERSDAGHTEAFSDLELTLLTHLTQGMSSKQIGDAVKLNSKTVEWHKANLMKKAGVKNTASLVAYAVKNGLT